MVHEISLCAPSKEESAMEDVGTIRFKNLESSKVNKGERQPQCGNKGRRRPRKQEQELTKTGVEKVKNKIAEIHEEDVGTIRCSNMDKHERPNKCGNRNRRRPRKQDQVKEQEKPKENDSASKWASILASAVVAPPCEFVPVRRYSVAELRRLRPLGIFNSVQVDAYHIEKAHQRPIPLWVPPADNLKTPVQEIAT
mmetsp:Transcript_29126/g.59672  ORF Transcript_29126/g.59672 Transcript_29126/m.59672 type:complete len:196 (+) Transcript_29126:206-793(+)|eukprot:CAMPEP_0181312000 /NCGR_PEP_ID=MMETSP1101-20121128/13454_1 /TAXON_ID=46948 /ORGANISM="Rhodomonas abbreviata, Strain Caron Lab Isolate" /LENGTH=195 /DNA_ID=CAMNT_0023418803 /DNA_START=206 /DNA_END=793 /DNA_ORIENTATION=+